MAPLSTPQIDDGIHNILKELSFYCDHLDSLPMNQQATAREACLMQPAYQKFLSLMRLLSDPEKSPLQFPNTSELSDKTSSPSFEMLRAGIWQVNLFSNKDRQNPNDFAADTVLSKVLLEKSLLAYSKLADLISPSQERVAQLSLVPKLIQSLESNTLLASLLNRYRTLNCTIKDVLSKPGTNGCQLEKARTAFILLQVYKAKQSLIEDTIKAIGLTGTSDQVGVQNMVHLLPLIQGLDELRFTRTLSGIQIAEALQDSSSAMHLKLSNQFRLLTQKHISFAPTDDDNPLSAYLYASYLITLTDLKDLYSQVSSLADLIYEIDPLMANEPDIQTIIHRSNSEIDTLVSYVERYIRQDETWSDE